MEEEIKEEIKQPTMKEKIDEVYSMVKGLDEKQIKKLKIPSVVKVKGGKLKKGFIGVYRIDQNRNITCEKVAVDMGAFVTKDGLTHGMNQECIYWLEGKYPIIFQPSYKKAPVNIDNCYADKKNETYLQPVIKAKMLKDVIKPKSNLGGGSLWWIIGGIIAVYFAYSWITGG